MTDLYVELWKMAEEQRGKSRNEITSVHAGAIDELAAAQTEARFEVARKLLEGRQALERRRHDVINSTDQFSLDMSADVFATDDTFARSRLALLSEFLILWLGSYFNASPRPDIWYDTIQILHRQDSMPNYAFTMKLYGDVYKRESRRIRRSGGAGTHILAVVDHSVVLRQDEWKLIMDTRKADYKDKTELSFEERKAIDDPSQASNPILFCAERMARLYAERQVLEYVRQFPIEFVVMPPKNDDNEIAAWKDYAEGKITGKDQQFTFLKRAASVHVDKIPICLLGAYVGVQRDLHQQFGDPLSHLKPSHAVNALRDQIRSVIASVPSDAREMWIPVPRSSSDPQKSLPLP